MTVHGSWIASCALAICLVTGLGDSLACGGEKEADARTAEMPVSIDGILAEADPPDKKSKGPSKTFAFKLLKSKSYIVDLASDDFDSFLRIEDAGGKELAWDDDMGDGLNSRLRLVPSKDGVYKIVASSLDGKAGKFQLKIRPVEPTQEIIPAAKEVSKDGFALEGKLVVDGPVDSGQQTKGAPRLIQPVKLKAGKTYQIDLISDDFDAFLRLENKDSKELAFDDDSGGDLNSRIVFVCKEDGEYRIIMTSLNRQPGSFVLKVRERQHHSVK